MKKRMNKLAALLLSAVMVFTLAACGGGNDNSSSDDSSGDAVSEDAGDADTDADDDSDDTDSDGDDTASDTADGENVKLKITWWGGQDRHEYTQEMLDYYSTEVAPNVEFEAVPAGWDGYFDKMATEAGSGAMPDIVAMDYLYISTFSTNNSLADLQEFVDSGVIDLSTIDEEFSKSGMIDGKLTGIVGGTSVLAVSYNPDVLAGAGVDEPEADWTWDEFAQICKTVQEETGKLGFAAIFGADDTNLLNYFIRQAGEQLIADDNKSLGYEDDQIFVDFVSFQQELIEAKAMPNPDEYDAIKVMGSDAGPVVTNEAAMVMEWQNYASRVAEMNDNIKLVSPPLSAEGNSGLWMKPGYFWSVAETSDAKEEAAKFINWIVNSEEAAEIMKLERGVPSSSNQRDYLQDSDDITEQEVAMFEYIDLAADLSGESLPPDPVGISEVNEALANAIYKVLYNQSTSEEAAAEFRSNANEILERNN